jgi:hypothetical protein
VAAAIVAGSGTTPTFVNSIGLASVTRIGAGEYEYTLTTPLLNATKYVVTAIGRTVGGLASAIIVDAFPVDGSRFHTFTTNLAGTLIDSDLYLTVTALP